MAVYKTRGVIIRSKPFEEAAKLVTVFTNDFGKVFAIAKGAKRPTSKFGGRLEPFSYLELSLARGRNLDILSQCETIESFKEVRKDHDRMKSAIYMLKVIDRSTVERQKNEKLFKLLVLSIMKLNAGEDIARTELYFDVNFLRAEGIYRKDAPPDLLISEHLNEDVRGWKR